MAIQGIIGTIGRMVGGTLVRPNTKNSSSGMPYWKQSTFSRLGAVGAAGIAYEGSNQVKSSYKKVKHGRQG